jgi:hypothetical protein
MEWKMWWKTDIDYGLSGKRARNVSLVLKVSPALKREFLMLVARMKQKRCNKTFEELVVSELSRRGKTLCDREFAKPKRR